MNQELPSRSAAVSLAERIHQGDRSAEDQLVAEYHRGVFLMALTRTRDPEAAREIAQETMASVLPALRDGKLREQEKLAAFICGTGRNLIHDHLRDRTLPRQAAAELHKARFVDPAEALERAERVKLMHQALQRLSAIDRKILLMTLVDGLKSGEIAARLGMGQARVRQRKSRAVRKIVGLVKKMSRT